MNLFKLDYLSIFLAVAATLIGIITLYGGGEAGEVYAQKKLVWLILGLAVMLTMSYVNYQSLGSYSFIFYGIAIFLLLITLVPFIGTKIKGARSWIRFFGFGFQPAEVMKLALVIALGKYLVLRESGIGKFKELVIPFLMTAVPMVLIAAQPDLGSAVLFLPILFAMLYIGGANTSIIFGLAIVGFFTMFIPMYLEYQKYIMVDSIYELLRDKHFQLADAIRILKFEVWHIIESGNFKEQIAQSSKYTAWAIKTVSTSENLKIFQDTVQQVEAANPSFIRDYLRNDIAILITIGATLLAYGLGYLGYFMLRSNWMKRASTVSLIISLSLISSYALRTLVSFKPHQVVRIVSFANPDKFPKGAGYQLRHSLITIGSGKFTGKGLFQGDMTRGETPFLPEWYNDFIFSVIGEQLGFIGATLTLLLLFGLVFRGAVIALQSKDDYGGVLAAGITSVFFFHIMVNIGITMGLFPVTGIPLVFVSYGGSNMIVSFAALGILLNIHRRRFINA